MKKLVKWGIGAVIGLCLPILFSLAYVQLNMGRIASDKSDCAVVFGAAVWRGDIPSHALNDRIQSGIGLYQSGLVNCLVLSGGPSRYGAHEVDVMKKIAIARGVSETDLVLDYAGLNTLATIKNLPPEKDFIFVSNDFHLARIGMLAWKYGIEEFQLHRAEYLNGIYLKSAYFTGREVFGILYYLLPEGVWGLRD